MGIIIDIIAEFIMDAVSDVFESSADKPGKKIALFIGFILAQALTIFMIYVSLAKLFDGVWYILTIIAALAFVAGWVYLLIKAIRKRK